MSTLAPMNVIVEQFTEMNEYFMEVAAGEGAAPVLLLIGTLLVAAAIGVFGLLTLGAVVDAVTPG